MQSELYITDDYDTIYQYAKNKAKELQLDFYSFNGDKNGVDTLVELAKEHINGVVFMCDVSKSPIFDALLPILEESDLHIILVSDKHDIKQAIISRCNTKRILPIYSEEITAFMQKKIVPKEITIGFLCALCETLMKDTKHYNALLKINDIIKDIQLSTNNILQDELKYRLKEVL